MAVHLAHELGRLCPGCFFRSLLAWLIGHRTLPGCWGMASLWWLWPGWPLCVPQGLPSFSGFAQARPCGSWIEQQCFWPQGAGLRTGPASLPPPSSDQSQPQLQPRFKGQENLHLLMAGAVESHDKTGGFSGRGITIIVWWSSSDSLGGCCMKTKKKNNTLQYRCVNQTYSHLKWQVGPSRGDVIQGRWAPTSLESAGSLLSNH